MGKMITEGDWHYVAKAYPYPDRDGQFGWAVMKFRTGNTVVMAEDVETGRGNTQKDAEDAAYAALDRIVAQNRKFLTEQRRKRP